MAYIQFLDKATSENLILPRFFDSHVPDMTTTTSEDDSSRARTPTAERLRQLRTVEGYETASEFARRLGITVPRYLNMEGGYPLTLQVAQRIVKLVPGCSLDWLYNDESRGLSVDLRQRLTALEAALKKRPGRSSDRRG
jgi:hypothetical protein